MTALLNPQQATLQHTCETPGLLFGACYDTATGTLYGAGTDGSVYRVDTKAEKPAAEKKWTHHDNYVSALVWLDGLVISCGYDRRLVWTRAETGEKIREIMAHDAWVRDLAVLPGGQRLATVGDDMLVRIWDATSSELIRSMDGHAHRTPEGFATAIYAVAASPDGKCVASADRIGHVCVWDVDTGKLLTRLQIPEFYTFDPKKRARSLGGIRSLLFLPDGRLAMSGLGPVSNVDGFVGPARFEIWDWRHDTMLHRGQDKHHAIVDHLAYVAEPELIIGGGGDAGPFLGFWNLQNEAPVHKATPKSHIQHFVYDSVTPRILGVGHGGFQIWSFAK